MVPGGAHGDFAELQTGLLVPFAGKAETWSGGPDAGSGEGDTPAVRAPRGPSTHATWAVGAFMAMLGGRGREVTITTRVSTVQTRAHLGSLSVALCAF